MRHLDNEREIDRLAVKIAKILESELKKSNTALLELYSCYRKIIKNSEGC